MSKNTDFAVFFICGVIVGMIGTVYVQISHAQLADVVSNLATTTPLEIEQLRISELPHLENEEIIRQLKNVNQTLLRIEAQRL